jgi:hypothetical protein
MRVARFTCMDAQTGRPPGIPRAALRGLLLALVIPALFGVHDRLARTTLEVQESKTAAGRPDRR